MEEFFDLSGEVTGFVSDVKSFYSNGGYYAIISQYYDAGLDSYNLNTIIVVLDFAQVLLLFSFFIIFSNK